ncbi:MAG TPA: protein-glutamate O-methyltransferase CheR [Polyangia bacterium]|nr:protein-glutamate O-methyltransferase CheR [Polyangia bacterium]
MSPQPQALVLPPEVRPLSAAEFGLYQRLVFREAGIHLGDVKQALVASRLLRRIRELGMTTYAAYYRRVVEEKSELVLMLDAITTNETQFFREPHHFDLLTTRLVPRWRDEAADGRRGRQVTLWSAGCSSGEEPYSLAMTLLSALPPEEGWQVQILGTDLSSRVLDRARQGIFAADRTAVIPRPLLERFMLRGVGSQEGNVKVAPVLEAAVTFRRLNLNQQPYALSGSFDAVFCRNVFIYFDRPTRDRIVEQMLEHLRPGGCFFVGHSESLGGVAGLETLMPTVYRKPERAGAEPAPRPVEDRA